MDFLINNSKWKVKNVSEDEMKCLDNGNTPLGLTDFIKQEIYLLKEQANVVKTLRHELMHVWLYEFGHNQNDKTFNNEDVCEIVSSSFEFINEKSEMFVTMADYE